MTEVQKPLVSTVTSEGSNSAGVLSSEASAASANGTVLLSDVTSGVQGIISALVANGELKETDAVKQMIEASPAVGTFVNDLQQAIFNAKAATTQGQLLSAQLASGSITQAEFQSQVASLSVPAAAMEAAVALEIPGATQKLLLAITSDNNLKVLKLLLATANAAVAKNAATLSSSSVPKDSSTVPTLSGVEDIHDKSASKDVEAAKIAHSRTKPLNSDASIHNANSQAALPTLFKDETLGFFQNLFKTALAAAKQNLKASASALLSLRRQPTVMNGARAVLKINGTVAALCTNVQYEVSSDWTEVRGIDELNANDLIPTNYSIKGSMTLYRVPNKSPIQSFVAQDMFRGIIWPYTSIEIRDKRTDEIIVQIPMAMITSRSEAFTKGQLTTTTMSFVGLIFRDEAQPLLLPDQLDSNAETGNSGLFDDFKSVGSSISKLF